MHACGENSGLHVHAKIGYSHSCLYAFTFEDIVAEVCCVCLHFIPLFLTCCPYSYGCSACSMVFYLRAVCANKMDFFDVWSFLGCYDDGVMELWDYVWPAHFDMGIVGASRKWRIRCEVGSLLGLGFC